MKVYTPRQLLAAAFLGIVLISFYCVRYFSRLSRNIDKNLSPPDIWAEIRGDVFEPGIYPLNPKAATLENLVKKAGGLKASGNVEETARFIPGERVNFGDSWKIEISSDGKVKVLKGKVKGSVALSLGLKMPLNSASEQDLLALPLMTRKLALEIVKYRELHGAITSPGELKNVRGVTEKRLERWKQYLSFER